MKIIKLVLLLSMTFLLASCVEQAQASISIITEDLTLEVGETFTLDVDIENPEDLYVYYVTSNREIATVYFGEIIAIAPGVVTISVELPGIYDSITLTVIETLNAETLAVVQMIEALTMPYTSVPVEAARDAYQLLSNDDQARVRNYQKLLDAEQYLVDIVDAQAVIDLIDAFASPLSKPEVGTARGAYSALSPEAQLLVTNYQVLVDAEKDILDAANVNLLIASFSTPVLQSEITAARSAYDALTPAAKLLVLDYQALLDAETAYNNQVAANAVITLINDFSDPVTVLEAAAARDAYDLLTSDQKALVTNYQALLDAEALLADQIAANLVKVMIDNLETEYLESDLTPIRTAYDLLTPTQQALVSNYQTFIDHEEAVDTVNLIIAFSTPVTSLEAGAARTSYNALTSDEKALVYNYDELLAAESYLVDIISAQEVIDAINAIPSSYIASDLTTVRSAYDALTSAQKLLVTNYQDLLDHEKAIDVVNLIINFSDPILVSEVQEARTAYDLLSTDEKALVYNYQVLTDEENKILDQAAADVVIALIDAFADPLVEATVTAARSAYNALTAAQKLLVTNYGDLTDAEALFTPQLARLKTISPDHAIDVINAYRVGDYDIFIARIMSDNEKRVGAIFDGNTKIYLSSDYLGGAISFAFDDRYIYYVSLDASNNQMLNMIDTTTKTQSILNNSETGVMYQLVYLKYDDNTYFKAITKFNPSTKDFSYYDFDTSTFVSLGIYNANSLNIFTFLPVSNISDSPEDVRQFDYQISDELSDFIVITYFEFMPSVTSGLRLFFDTNTLKPIQLDTVFFNEIEVSEHVVRYYQYNDLVMRIRYSPNPFNSNNEITLWDLKTNQTLLNRSFTGLSFYETSDGLKLVVQDYFNPLITFLPERNYDFYDHLGALTNSLTQIPGETIQINEHGQIFAVDMTSMTPKIGFIDGANQLVEIDFQTIMDLSLMNSVPLKQAIQGNDTTLLSDIRYEPSFFLNKNQQKLHYFDTSSETFIEITTTESQLPEIYVNAPLERNMILTVHQDTLGIINLLNNTYINILELSLNDYIRSTIYLGHAANTNYYQVIVYDNATYDHYVIAINDLTGIYEVKQTGFNIFYGRAKDAISILPELLVFTTDTHIYVYSFSSVAIYSVSDPTTSTSIFNTISDYFVLHLDVSYKGESTQHLYFPYKDANDENMIMYCIGDVNDPVNLTCYSIPDGSYEMYIVKDDQDNYALMLNDSNPDASKANRLYNVTSDTSTFGFVLDNMIIQVDGFVDKDTFTGLETETTFTIEETFRIFFINR